MKCYRNYHPTPMVNESVLVKTLAFRVIIFKTGCGNINWVTFCNIFCGFSNCLNFQSPCWCVGSLFQTDVNDSSTCTCIWVDVLHRPISVYRLCQIAPRLRSAISYLVNLTRVEAKWGTLKIQRVVIRVG